MNSLLVYTYANLVLIAVVYAVSLNVLYGQAGQVSVAQTTFGAAGGYVMATLWLHNHWPTLDLIGLGIVAATVLGAIVALPAMRLRTEWLMLFTLALSAILAPILTAIPVFGGSYGLENISPSILGFSMQSAQSLLVLVVVSAAVVCGICTAIVRSRYGRLLRVIREDESIALSVGKGTYWPKVLVFTGTAGMAGLAGALTVLANGIASPSLFDFNTSLTIFAMVILGGQGNLVGSTVGAAVVILSEPLLQYGVRLSPQSAAIWQSVVYGALLIVFIVVRPAGIVPEGTVIFRRLIRFRQLARPATDEAGVRERSALRLRSLALAAPVLDGRGNGMGDELDGVVLRVESLTKAFGGIKAVDDLTLSLRRGMVTTLIGPNGAGKTTVFNLLTGTVPLDTGRVFVGRHEVTGMGPAALARLGVVRSFQDGRIVRKISVIDNVVIARDRHAGTDRRRGAGRRVDVDAGRWEAEVLLDEMGLLQKRDVLAGQLSFGEQKLVALARVLATGAGIILLDEPAAGLEEDAVATLIEVLGAVRGAGRTVCVVEHNLEIVEKIADRTYFMEQGRVVGEGEFHELISRPGLSDAYFGARV